MGHDSLHDFIKVLLKLVAPQCLSEFCCTEYQNPLLSDQLQFENKRGNNKDQSFAEVNHMIT